jgi:type 1 fimbriae regulatory protein FimB/type 1 fimbriae regulatory protein FimE
MNTVVQLRPSRSEKPTVRSGRAKNADYRQREYLTEGEIDSLLATAGNSRNAVRDRLLILMAFRHALRVSELVDIRWQQINLDTATIHIRRAKNGTPGIHGLQGDELGCCGHYVASILMSPTASCDSSATGYLPLTTSTSIMAS